MARAIQEERAEAWRPALRVIGRLIFGKPVTFSDRKQAVSKGVQSKTAARLSHTLKKGNPLVVPRSVSRGRGLGWWQIDPKTGDTLAVLDGLNMGYGNWNGGSAKGFGGQKVFYTDPETGRGGEVKKRKGGGSEWAGTQKLSTMITYRTVKLGTLLKWGVVPLIVVGVVVWLAIR